jgi:hypothetical protein
MARDRGEGTVKTLRAVMFAVFYLCVVAAAGWAEGPATIVIDPAAGGMVVSIGGRLYTATLTPVGGEAPAVTAADSLTIAAKKYMYDIVEYHRAIADAIDTDMTLTTEVDVGKRAIRERDAALGGMGRALADALKASGGFGVAGVLEDRRVVSGVFRRAAAGMESVLKK